MGGLIVVFLAGAIDGIVEGFEFDGRKSFERKYNVDEFGFWGSKSWTRRTTDPNIWNRWFGVFDFYHIGDDLRAMFYLLGATLLAQDYRLWLALLIGWVAKGVGKWLGMGWIRN